MSEAMGGTLLPEPGGDSVLPEASEVFAAASRLVKSASAAGLALGTAESCTGGLVSAAITAVPGSSEVFRGGVASYALEVKRDVLGVSWELLSDPELGAVTPECAEQMACGARRVLGCDVAVSVTGIAGPGGEEPGKPVGTVWFGVAGPDGYYSVVRHLSGDRDEVRSKATMIALGLLQQIVDVQTNVDF